MRVRIQYSVDFDEVPDKVGVFLKNVADGLLEVSKNLRQEADIIKDGHSTLESLEVLESSRRELEKVDVILADSLSILQGYIGTRDNPLSRQDPEVPEDVLPEG
jgi:hypothetical protein